MPTQHKWKNKQTNHKQNQPNPNNQLVLLMLKHHENKTSLRGNMSAHWKARYAEFK